MKQQILDYLKTDRSWATGSALYMQFGNNRSFKQSINRQGETKHILGTIHEELRKLADISPMEFKRIMSVAITPKAVMSEKAAEVIVAATTEEAEKIIATMPEPVKKVIRLREEFPFLRDPNCPREFKIMVADMISAYETYKAAHESLFVAETHDELLAAASATVENYIENQEIWDELNYYKEKGQVLGKHKVFKQMQEYDELVSMSAADLAKKKKNLGNNLVKLRKQIADGDRPDLLQQRQDLVKHKEQLLVEIDRLLAIR